MADHFPRPVLLLISGTFSRYWLSHFSSSFANSLTSFLIPLIGVLVFDATAFEMGALVAVQEAPVVLFSLIIGGWLDRMDLRRMLIVTLVVQAVVVGLMGGLLFSELRSLALLYATAGLLGTVKLVIDLAGTTYLPSLVRREQLVSANSRLQISMSSVRVLGPVLGGVVAKTMPVLGFVFAFFGHLLGAVLLMMMRQDTVRPTTAALSWHADIRSGLRLLFEVTLLRPVILSSCLGALSVGMFSGLLVYALVEKLGLDEINAGLMVAVTGAATFVASVIVPRLTHVLGAGWVMILGVVCSALGFVLFAISIYVLNVLVTVQALLLVGTGTSLFSINQISVRQAVTRQGFWAGLMRVDVLWSSPVRHYRLTG